MTPYLTVRRFLRRHSVFLLLIISLSYLMLRSGLAAEKPQVQYVTSKNDALTRSGFDHYYDLDYDGAIRDFQRTLEAHPDDPFAVNHLLAAVFFKELYRAGAMESNAYADNSFLSQKQPIVIDDSTNTRIKELIAKAGSLAEARLKENPNDADAFYARGVARGMASTYTALVQKSWFSALGDAKGARHDHEEVLRLNPNYSDAQLIVGMHSYIVGNLPWAVRVLAHVVGESGNRADGIKDLYSAANGGGDASTDAKVVLALFLRREQRFADALNIERSLTAAHPRNFLFALEEANILKDSGKGAESIAAYHKVIADAEGHIFFDPHLEFAYYGLGEALNGQKDFAGAADAYETAAKLPRAAGTELRLRSELAAGHMYDLLQKRDLAVQKYQTVIAQNAGSDQASIARKNLKEPYHY